MLKCKGFAAPFYRLDSSLVQSKPLEPAPPPVRPIKGKGKGKAEVLVKEKRKTVETKSKQGSTAASAQPKDKPKAGGLHVKNVRQEPALKPL